MAAASFDDTGTSTCMVEDFGYTTKVCPLYAIEVGWPCIGEAVILVFGSPAGSRKDESVDLFGS